ncbi:UTRA domain-containing protein [Streptomyces sp. NBC_01224]|uniref:UTRA domain-containing protein n=1 Tax=Streptomyces sp. NBC_01224 TaxID=2903783 RepID=UPI002E0E7D7F
MQLTLPPAGRPHPTEGGGPVRRWAPSSAASDRSAESVGQQPTDRIPLPQSRAGVTAQPGLYLRPPRPGAGDVPGKSLWYEGVEARLTELRPPLAEFREKVSARFPTPEETATPRIRSALAVLAITRVVTDTTGRVVETALPVLPGDRADAVFTDHTMTDEIVRQCARLSASMRRHCHAVRYSACPSMRTMGGVVAEVSSVGQSAAWSCRGSGVVAMVAALRCCTARLVVIAGRPSGRLPPSPTVNCPSEEALWVGRRAACS